MLFKGISVPNKFYIFSFLKNEKQQNKKIYILNVFERYIHMTRIDYIKNSIVLCKSKRKSLLYPNQLKKKKKSNGITVC